MNENEVTKNENEATETEKAPTAAELLAKINDLESKLEKQKKATDAASADASKWKQEFRRTQSEQERAAAESAEESSRIKNELEMYKEKERISTYKAKLMTAGYDEFTAGAMAGKLSADVSDEFFEAQKNFLTEYKKQADINALNGQGQPSAGKAISQKAVEEAETAKLRGYFGL